MTVSGFDHNLLTGEVDGARRQEMVDEFQDPDGNHFILLVSTLAGGTGLNLTAVCAFDGDATELTIKANKVVIFDPAWSKSRLPRNAGV